jgi:hypothetical protein
MPSGGEVGQLFEPELSVEERGCLSGRIGDDRGDHRTGGPLLEHVVVEPRADAQTSRFLLNALNAHLLDDQEFAQGRLDVMVQPLVGLDALVAVREQEADHMVTLARHVKVLGRSEPRLVGVDGVPRDEEPVAGCLGRAGGVQDAGLGNLGDACRICLDGSDDLDVIALHGLSPLPPDRGVARLTVDRGQLPMRPRWPPRIFTSGPCLQDEHGEQGRTTIGDSQLPGWTFGFGKARRMPHLVLWDVDHTLIDTRGVGRELSAAVRRLVSASAARAVFGSATVVASACGHQAAPTPTCDNPS